GHFAESTIKVFLIVGKVIGAELALLEEKANNLLRTAGQIGKNVAIGTTAGAAVGSVVPGVGTALGAGTGAILGLFNALTTATPGSARQAEILKEMREEI